MRNRLSSLHNPYNRRLGFELPVRRDALVGLFVLGFSLAGLDLVYFDAVFWVREGGVDGEGVGGVDVFAFGVFGEDAVAGTGEGLEGALELVIV